LPNGNTVIADNGRMKVIEIDKDLKVVWEFDVPNDKQAQDRDHAPGPPAG